MKQLTREQIQFRKDKAVRFTRNVLGDPDRASEIADEDLDSYAERKRFEISNPTGRKRTMPRTRTKTELEAEIEDLEAENQELQEQLDSIADIVGGNDDEEDDSEDSDDSESAEDDAQD